MGCAATTFACWLFAYQGWYTHQGYDIIMNTVGILFIHDLDEKLYEAVSMIHDREVAELCNGSICVSLSKCRVCQRTGQCLRRNLKLVLTVLFWAFMTLLGYEWLFDYFEANVKTNWDS